MSLVPELRFLADESCDYNIVRALRADGHDVLAVSDETTRSVGRRSDISLEEEWGEREPHTQIVAIGAPDSIDEDELTTLFESCVANPVTAR